MQERDFLGAFMKIAHKLAFIKKALPHNAKEQIQNEYERHLKLICWCERPGKIINHLQIFMNMLLIFSHSNIVTYVSVHMCYDVIFYFNIMSEKECSFKIMFNVHILTEKGFLMDIK